MGYDQWIVKFRSTADPTDIGAEEYAYALMAADAGIDMAETRLLETRKGARLFATKRFDRTGQGRLHMHTIGGLINADHRIPSLDYRDIIKATRMMTRDQAEVLRMFRRMVFNILAYNRDDHAKNHAFLMDGSGTWKLSPAYDLTFSTGPGGEHSTTVAGQGRNPAEKDILDVAKEASIDGRTARREIDRVRSAIDNWRVRAADAGLSHQRTSELDLRLNPGRKTNMADG
jgi:serine/threonine-protein kinase HipA